MDELLFTNIDVTSTAVASLLLNIAENPSFQEALRQEIAKMKSDESYNVQQYIAKRDVLLHFAVLESFRMRPVLCKYFCSFFSLFNRACTNFRW